MCWTWPSNSRVVITERDLEGPNLRSIHVDQKFGGYLATRHLLALGHTRIAHIAVSRTAPMRKAGYLGYLEAHAEAGVEPGPAPAGARQLYRQRRSCRSAAFDRGGISFTAIFCANDDTALGARLALYQRGLRVPEDVSLVGFDDMPTSSFMTPPLTSVRQPVYEVGLYAARMLLDMMGVPRRSGAVAPLELMVRETTRKWQA